MKLIIKQYLASLKERGELDCLVPDLLSQMGLNVFLKPGVGNRQYGVDVAAYGKLPGESEDKVYLFSIKGKDLTRSNWDSGTPQDLRPSLVEILDVFIPNRLPREYSGKKVVVCLCIGGEIKEEVRESVSTFCGAQENRGDRIHFSEWNGDKLASLIEQNFLREDLLAEQYRGLLRKSLAMLDEPDVSYKHFSNLLSLLTNFNGLKDKDKLMRLRQIYLCLWILYAWCRDGENLESILLSSELSMLYVWNEIKSIYSKKSKFGNSIRSIYCEMLRLHLRVSNEYFFGKIIPQTQVLYALSRTVGSSCSVDVNLKMFDLLGRMSLYGIWVFFVLQRMSSKDSEDIERMNKKLEILSSSVANLVKNNLILLNPYKDNQIVDIALAFLFLMHKKEYHPFLSEWLFRIVDSVGAALALHRKYPSTIDNYEDLLTHPLEQTDEYRMKVTKGSVMMSYLAVLAAKLHNKQVFEMIKDIKNKLLSHCNLQVHFLDESSEEHFYRNDEIHGATLSHISLEKDPSNLLNFLAKECELSDGLSKMSAMRSDLYPLILSGCRHYRLPIPMYFLLIEQRNNS